MRYFIIGNGSYAVLLCRYLQRTHSIKVDGFVVPEEIIEKRQIDDINVISTESFKNNCAPANCRLFVGIGYRNMNRIKEREFCKYKEYGYKFENYIHPTAIIENDVQIGEGNNIFEGVIIQSGAIINNANLIYSGALVAHDTVIGNFNSISVKACIAGCTNIGNNCFFGANSTVRDHIRVADFSLVGAGVYLRADTNPYEVFAAPKVCALSGKKSLELI